MSSTLQKGFQNQIKKNKLFQPRLNKLPFVELFAQLESEHTNTLTYPPSQKKIYISIKIFLAVDYKQMDEVMSDEVPSARVCYPHGYILYCSQTLPEYFSKRTVHICQLRFPNFLCCSPKVLKLQQKTNLSIFEDLYCSIFQND